MVRTILANRRHEAYLQKCGEEHQFTYGVIIGQPTEQNKDYIVHLARNSEQDVDGNCSADIPERVSDGEIAAEATNKTPDHVASVAEIDGQALVHQVVSVTKMLPGCFYVLGIFVVSEKNIFADEDSITSAKLLLHQVNSILKQNKHFCGISTSVGGDGKLLLSYSTQSKTTVCKVFESKENGGFFMPGELKYLDKAIDWHKIESNFELDDVFPIVEREGKVNIEDHFQKSLEAVTGYVQNSEIFIQNENLDETLILEALIKQKQSKNEPIESIAASIFLPAIASANDPIRVEKFNGSVRFTGIIASRVWSHPKNTIREIHTFIRHDIVRSLAARIQIYCDGLTDPTAAQDAMVVSEPPRRVFFDLPDGNGIQFSEYIFRGEAPTVAAAQAKEMLDLDIDSDQIHSDLEGLLDDDAFATHADSGVAPARGAVQQEISRTMYIVGLAVAFLVLLVSILLHFIYR